MEHRSVLRLSWAICLAVYWSILIATAIVTLASSPEAPLFLVVLVAGLPVYLLASGAIVRSYETRPADTSTGATVIRLVLSQSEDTPNEIAPGKRRVHKRRVS